MQFEKQIWLINKLSSTAWTNAKSPTYPIITYSRSEDKDTHKTDYGLGASAAVILALFLRVAVKRELSYEVKLFQLWSQALGSDRKNEIEDSSCQDEVPLQGGRSHTMW